MRRDVTQHELEEAMRDARCRGSLESALGGRLGEALRIALTNTVLSAEERRQRHIRSRSRVDVRRIAAGDTE